MLYDVIISGAGPSGSACAYTLAKNGVKVLVLEKANLPRNKMCGGGVPGVVFNLMPIGDLKDDSLCVTRYGFTLGGGKPVEGSFSRDRLYSVDRAVFDSRLAMEARNAGAELMEDACVMHAAPQQDKVTVTTEDGRKFNSKYLVAADGGHSRIATALRFFKHPMKDRIGISGFFQVVPDKQTDERFEKRVHLDFNFFKNGVVGVIPKGDHLWVGAYTRKKIKLYRLEKYTEKFIQKMGIKGEKGEFTGIYIPHYRRDAQLQKGRVLLAGEAARLVNPLSGEGVKPAMESGIIAANTIREYLKNGENTEVYTDRIHNRIGSELDLAGHFAYLAYLFPSLAYEGMTRVVNESLDIMNGEASYYDFVKRLRKKIIRKIMRQDAS